MGIDRFGRGLGTPAPESTASLGVPGPAPLALDAVPLVGMSRKKAPAQVVGSRQTYERGDQIGLESINGSNKKVNTPVAVMALNGYSLSRIYGEKQPEALQIKRRGAVRQLRDTQAARTFARQVGASNA